MATRDSRRGSVLVLSLWSLSLLAAFAVSMGYMVRQKVTLLDRIEKRQLLWDAAWSAVESARSLIKQDADLETDSYGDRWANDPGAFRSVSFGKVSYTVHTERPSRGKKKTVYGLSDEQGKLNLNFADPPAISLLLQQVTLMDADEADAVAYAIVDWRDGDSAYGHPDKGAEDSDYQDLPLPYDAKDQPYQSLDELFLVKGMNRDIFEKMTHHITVFGSGTVNLNTAGREVLVALGLPMTAADKLLRHRDGGDGEPGTGDDRIFTNISSVTTDMQRDEPPLNEIERTAIENLAGSGKAGITTGIFGLTSFAESEDGRSELVIEATLNRDADVLFCRSTGFRWRGRGGSA